MEENEINRTLTKNSIRQFILRFDFMPAANIDFINIINNISESADRTEKRIKTGFQFNFQNGKSEVSKVTSEDYVLINDTTGISVTFSKGSNAFWLETKQYLDNYLLNIFVLKLISLIRHSI